MFACVVLPVAAASSADPDEEVTTTTAAVEVDDFLELFPNMALCRGSKKARQYFYQ
jgi:hypothetical protein